MSSPPLRDDHKDTIPTEAGVEAGVASATLPSEISNSKDTSAATEQIGNAVALPSRPATAKLAFDDTLPGFKPCTEDTEINDKAQDDELPYPDIEEASLLPPPDFKPLFTLIEDPTTGDHYHPTVHYLFSDDDQEILTAAALETVSDEQQQPEFEDERFVIVDMNADGREVVTISSISPDWQNLKTKVTQAPSWGDQSQAGDRGLMLRISGQEAEVVGDRKQKGNVDELLKAFDDLAGTLDEMLGPTILDTDTQNAQ